MIRAALAILLIIGITSDAEARRRRYYKIVRVAKSKPIEQPATRAVRIIPVLRWQLWCERVDPLVNALECPRARHF